MDFLQPMAPPDDSPFVQAVPSAPPLEDIFQNPPAYNPAVGPPTAMPPAYNPAVGPPDMPPAYNPAVGPAMPHAYRPSAGLRDASRIRRLEEKAELERQKRELAEEKVRHAQDKAAIAERNKNPIHVVKSLYGSPIIYDKLYNWGLDLIPSYYNNLEKKRLQTLLNNMISRELRKNESEDELKDKIKTLITEIQEKHDKPKSPRRSYTKQVSPKRAASPKRKKSPKQTKTKGKKSPKRSPKRK